jgi:WD40 repeat protein
MAAGPDDEALPPGYHDRPVLVVDPGRHAAGIRRADVDAAGRFVVTASHDKTVRVWSAETGALERTIRLPAGPGNIGKAYAVAISPDGTLIAAGGWTAPSAPNPIFLHARETGALEAVIPGLPEVVFHLAFSPDGRFLAATLGGAHGLRVFDRERAWAEVARGEGYGDSSYGAAFSGDGRLATTSDDGRLRLYSPGPRVAELKEVVAPGGAQPSGIAFSPDGLCIAVGYDGTTRVDVLDGYTLEPLHAADTEGFENGNLAWIAWEADGSLLAAGRYADGSGSRPVIAWADGGRGARRVLPAGRNTVMSLKAVRGGDIVVAAADPWLGRLGADGAVRWAEPSPLADFRDQRSTFGVSADGGVVAFGFQMWGGQPARFEVAALALTLDPATDGRTAPPRQTGLKVETWANEREPTLDGSRLALYPNETSRSLAIHPDGARFVLGADWSLRAFSAAGEPLWRQDVPGAVWAVSITGDGRLVVAAYGDGTIRWHRMDDQGREILAFMPLAEGTDWVAWTPEGFHAATPGARDVLRWHINHGGFRTSAHPVADIPGFHRPDMIPLVLREMDTASAIGRAAIAEQKRKLDLLAPAGLPAGAKLHLLAVGISAYEHPALALRFAARDAEDIARRLRDTQVPVYAIGRWETLLDDKARRGDILANLEWLRNGMGPDDLAVFLFSGHGLIVDEQLYLAPWQADTGTLPTIKDTCLGVNALRDEIMNIAARGRVLVLLDACFSGGMTDDHAVRAAAARLSHALAATNITVLTSSSASQTSKEDAAWGHGALANAVLEALDGAADENKDGLLSGEELGAYVSRRVRALTGGRQNPAMELRFGGTLFAVR